VFAYNQTFSQSGYANAYWHLEPSGFWFENRYCTEQHLESARAVAQGRADIASIDIVSWQLINRYETFTGELRVLELTAPQPGLPLITAKGNDTDAIFVAVDKAIAQMTDADKELLGLKGIVKISAETYLAMQNPPINVW